MELAVRSFHFGGKMKRGGFMAERGGQSAADGFQYQYLTTLEALLEVSEGDSSEIAAVVVEPAVAAAARSSALDGGGSTGDSDVIDFELVDAEHRTLVAVQVKSGGPGTEMSGPVAFGVLLRMIRARPDACQYRLITNIRLHPKAARLKSVLDNGVDPEDLREVLRRILERSTTWRSQPNGLEARELEALSRARIETDIRDRYTLRAELRERLRRYRSQRREGLGLRSAGRMSSHLVVEIFRRASGELNGLFTIEDFRAELLVDGADMAHELGLFDWGVMVGPVPAPPALSRPVLLARIAATLRGERSSRDVVECVVLGLSGMGKTSLAAAHAHDLADSYDQIFWIDAESEATLVRSFQTVGDWIHRRGDQTVLNGTQMRDQVHAHLSASAGRWLMVFDNAHGRRSLQEWIPSHGRGDILITSTDQASWATHPNKIEIPVLTPAESTSLIRTRLALTLPWNDEAESSATELGDAMAHWPLAIELACGYLAGCERGLSELPRYLSRIRDLALDDAESIPPGYPRTLVGAIRVALQRLPQGRRVEVAGLAFKLMISAAYFASSRIPFQLLLSVAILPRDLVTTEDAVLPMIDDDPEGEAIIDHAHRALRSESLAHRDDPLCDRASGEYSDSHPEGVDETVGVNEIVQYVVRSLTEKDGDVSQALSRAAFHARHWLAFFMELGDEEHMLAVLPHADSVARHAERLCARSDDIAILWGNLGVLYQHLGEHTSARRWLELELEYVMGRHEPAPALELKIHTELADIECREGRSVEEVLSRLRRVRALAVQLAETRPRTVAESIANALVVLSAVTYRTEPSREAEELLADLVSLRSRLPTTSAADLVTEINEINALLHDAAVPPQSVERRCRGLLEGGRLPPMQRVHVLGLLAECLALQGHWTMVEACLGEITDYAHRSPLNPHGIAAMVHNVGLCVGSRAMDGTYEWRPALSAVLRIAELLKPQHFASDPAVPLKLGILRLVEAIGGGDMRRTARLRHELKQYDAAVFLAPAYERRWRELLVEAVLASVVVAPD
ncbi:tetratricopeptide repeat protein [Catenulispora pinisilvae]|uniref:tetratricopeptide repeat protein n=1 Tax=Catenulispora pinisilvae TaxID=2705253 RepID=UPI001891E156|nr:tetratricopeptide repeat protein [Catenulispora pinisilvae]